MTTPEMQSHVLFEHYGADGSLLVVTSDKASLTLAPGDFIVRRKWMTADAPEEVNRAASGCTCGSPSATASRDGEVLVHRADGPCYFADATKETP